jgi:hypothetical protein
MKHLLILLIAAFCAVASASGQTIRSLGFNTTNGFVVYSGTNTLTFTNSVNFAGGDLLISNQTIQGSGVSLSFEDGELTGTVLLQTNAAIEFAGAAASTTRTNLSLGLPALTNTSNVTMMRALAGSTNTNQPFSGIVAIKDFNDDTHNVTISNGIIVEWQAP